MISFKILTEESAEAMLDEIATLCPGADMDFASENIEMMLDDGDTEYALSCIYGCLLIRLFDGEYSFVCPLPLTDDADVTAAVDEIRKYAIKEEIPLLLCDLPSEELGRILPLFRHANIDATDPDNECYTVRIISEAAMIDELPIVNGAGEVCLTPLTEGDDELYFSLCTDPDTNKYWGYNYAEDEPDPSFSYFRESAEADFSRGSAISLAVRVCGEFAGEATLYGFDLLGGCECAVRLLPSFRHRGYATESLRLLMRLAKGMGLVYLSATVDINNVASKHMTENCLLEISRDDFTVKYRKDL